MAWDSNKKTRANGIKRDQAKASSQTIYQKVKADNKAKVFFNNKIFSIPIGVI